MLFEGVIISIIVGYIRKGRLRQFENITIKLWYLISVAFLIQVFAIRISSLSDSFFYVLHLFSYVIITYVCILNRELLSVVFLGIGNFLNFLVIGFNSGKMPVNVPEDIIDPYFDRGHCLMTIHTRLSFLGDIFVSDLPVFGVRVFSVGDFLLIIGAFLLVQYGMTYKKNYTS